MRLYTHIYAAKYTNLLPKKLDLCLRVIEYIDADMSITERLYMYINVVHIIGQWMAVFWRGAVAGGVL